MAVVRHSIVVLILAACGGETTGSGVDRDTPLVTLSDAEISELCEFTVSLGPITGNCGNGEQVTIGKLTVGECIAQYEQRRELFGTCTATVAHVEDCTEQFLPYTPQMLCADNIVLPEPCVVLFTSECGGL